MTVTLNISSLNTRAIHFVDAAQATAAPMIIQHV
jgi:hypothetical protein